ncbi:MAG: hypothetical protein ACLFNQ_11635 [Spirochaetaceae bacterium]
MTTVIPVAHNTEESRTLEMLGIASIAFLVPFLLGGPQILVGTVVNGALIYAALRGRWTQALPVVMLPSIAVLSRGVIFGGLTPFLLVLMPYIWISNVILVSGIRFCSRGRCPAAVAIIASCVVKVAFLYASALLLARSGLIPGAMVNSMGTMQLVTALAGAGLVGFGAAIRSAIRFTFRL